jgi:hypothetical protein
LANSVSFSPDVSRLSWLRCCDQAPPPLSEVSIESLDASKAIYRLIKYKFHKQDAEREEEQQSALHILDLKTLTAVLTGEGYALQSACEIFGAPASRARNHRSRVTKPAIESLLRNVTGELGTPEPPHSGNRQTSR